MRNVSILVFVIFLLTFQRSNVLSQFYIIPGGGYSISLCLRGPNITNYKKFEISCKTQIINCTKGKFHLCKLPCSFSEKVVYNDNKRIDLIPTAKPIFKLLDHSKLFEETMNNLTIHTTSGNLSLVQPDEISISFTKNVSCIQIFVNNQTIKCLFSLSGLSFSNKESVNVSISYGDKCNLAHIGSIFLMPQSYHMKLWLKYYWLFILILMSTVAIIFVLVIITMNRKNNNETTNFHKQLQNEQIVVMTAQKKAFLEYQLAISSFNNLGKLTPRHLLPFHEYVAQIFDVELNTKLSKGTCEDLEDFKMQLLDKEILTEWISRVEERCRKKERLLVASFLSLFLFQHPDYFLEIIKSLLKKLVIEMKSNSNERSLFKNQERIIEMMVGNWISLCMYGNIRTGIYGERFFNLYRAIKCKINSGLVDNFTNKAKYTLSMDYLLTGDHAYDILNIKANVNIELRMLDKSQRSLPIVLDEMEVEVLSLDSISQVKEKILDKAIMLFVESENPDDSKNEFIPTIGPLSYNDFHLYFVNNTTSILLNNFDHTSIASLTDEQCIVVNTMKHYNLRSGSRFILKSIASLNMNDEKLFPSKNQVPVHLQLSQNVKTSHQGIKKIDLKETNKKFVFQQTVDNMKKEPYLMLLLATKKSLRPIIDGFIQCIMNWKATKIVLGSNDSLFYDPAESILSSNQFAMSNMDLQNSECEDGYLKPIYYLFSILDDIAQFSSIEDQVIIQSWKSDSFILNFWANLIRNPHTIFSVEKIRPVDSCLDTIAEVLQYSTSAESAIIDKDLSMKNQLFLEDIKNSYSYWWLHFVNSAQPVSDADMVYIMDDIVKENSMNRYNTCALRNLEIVKRTLFIEVAKKRPYSIPMIPQ